MRVSRSPWILLLLQAVLIGERGHRVADRGRRLERLEHLARGRVQAVVLAGAQVEHDRLRDEAAMDDVLGQSRLSLQQLLIG